MDTPDAPAVDMWDDLTPEKVALIWGEAVELFRRGEKLYLPKDLERVAREVQETYEEENPREGIVVAYLDRALPEGWDDLDLYARRAWLETDAVGTVPREHVCTLEIWAEALGGNPDKLDRYGSKEIRDIMARQPEWHRNGKDRMSFKLYGQQRFFERSGRNG